MNDRADDPVEGGSVDPTDRGGQFYDLTGAKLPPEFEFIRLLGQGSMGLVCLARNVSLKRLVAFKILRPELAANAVSRKRFIREAQAAARIAHPNVTSVYSVGSLSNGLPYLEMQYIKGTSLDALLRSKGPIEPTVARALLTQIAQALAAAHENRVVHRDVKPANVLIENDSGHVFLTDFGIAGILASGSEAVTRLTMEGDPIGDPRYNSPEHVRGEPLTEQTDIYSLGILGYEALTSHSPFVEAKITDIAAAHIRRPPLDLHASRPDIPADLSATLKRCLAKKPEHRPRAKDLVELFERGNPIEKDLPLPGAFISFLRELKERNVYRAAAAYAAFTFVILQVAELVLLPLDAPDWLFRLIVVASLIGFPLTIVMAWIYDLRQGQLMRTDDDYGAVVSRATPAQRLVLKIFGLLLSIGIAAAVAWWLLVTESSYD